MFSLVFLSFHFLISARRQLFNRTLSPETLSLILEAIAKTMDRDPRRSIRIATEMGRASQRIALGLMCLNDEGRACLREILLLARGGGSGLRGKAYKKLQERLGRFV